MENQLTAEMARRISDSQSEVNSYTNAILAAIKIAATTGKYNLVYNITDYFATTALDDENYSYISTKYYGNLVIKNLEKLGYKILGPKMSKENKTLYLEISW